MITSTAKIVDFNIEIVERIALTAVLTLNVDGEPVIFGGPELFASLPSEVSNNFFSHFIFRCMQVTGSSKIMQMHGQNVQIKMVTDRIIGICNLEGNDWFYPVTEFEDLEKGTDED